MEAKLKIVGLGPGAKEYVLPLAKEALQEAKVIMGSKRSLETVQSIGLGDGKETMQKRIEISYPFSKMMQQLDLYKDQKVVVAVAGDTGFYSLLDYIEKRIEKTSYEVIPGISSFQYLLSKLKKTYHQYPLKSLHGRELDFLSVLSQHPGLFLLTDKIHTPSKIATLLIEAGKGEYMMTVGENLSYSDEKITKAKAVEWVGTTCHDLSVVLIECEECKGV
jgi:cobalt-precorrin-7 (C5)-methyltransferase